jgi:hypothetical protein
MHRFGPSMVSFLGFLLAGLGGCADVPPANAPIRSVFVEETATGSAPSLARSADIIHDVSVRTLLRHGYLAAAEPADADAILRSEWFARPGDAASIAGRVSLRMTLVGRDGARRRVFDVVTAFPVGFLTDDRIAELVRTKLDANLP